MGCVRSGCGVYWDKKQMAGLGYYVVGLSVDSMLTPKGIGYYDGEIFNWHAEKVGTSESEITKVDATTPAFVITREKATTSESEITKVDATTPDFVITREEATTSESEITKVDVTTPAFVITREEATTSESEITKVDATTPDFVITREETTASESEITKRDVTTPAFVITLEEATTSESEITKVDATTPDFVITREEATTNESEITKRGATTPAFVITREEATTSESEITKVDATTPDFVITREEATTNESEITKVDATTPDFVITREETTASESEITKRDVTTTASVITREEVTTSESEITTEKVSTSESDIILGEVTITESDIILGEVTTGVTTTESVISTEEATEIESEITRGKVTSTKSEIITGKATTTESVISSELVTTSESEITTGEDLSGDFSSCETLHITYDTSRSMPQRPLFGLYLRSNTTFDGRPVYMLEETTLNRYNVTLYHTTTAMTNEWVISETAGQREHVLIRIFDDAMFPEFVQKDALSKGFFNDEWMDIPSLQFNCFKEKTPCKTIYLDSQDWTPGGVTPSDTYIFGIWTLDTTQKFNNRVVYRHERLDNDLYLFRVQPLSWVMQIGSPKSTDLNSSIAPLAISNDSSIYPEDITAPIAMLDSSGKHTWTIDTFACFSVENTCDALNVSSTSQNCQDEEFVGIYDKSGETHSRPYYRKIDDPKYFLGFSFVQESIPIWSFIFTNLFVGYIYEFTPDPLKIRKKSLTMECIDNPKLTTVLDITTEATANADIKTRSAITTQLDVETKDSTTTTSAVSTESGFEIGAVKTIEHSDAIDENLTTEPHIITESGLKIVSDNTIEVAIDPDYTTESTLAINTDATTEDATTIKLDATTEEETSNSAATAKDATTAKPDTTTEDTTTKSDATTEDAKTARPDATTSQPDATTTEDATITMPNVITHAINARTDVMTTIKHEGILEDAATTKAVVTNETMRLSTGPADTTSTESSISNKRNNVTACYNKCSKGMVQNMNGECVVGKTFQIEITFSLRWDDRLVKPSQMYIQMESDILCSAERGFTPMITMTIGLNLTNLSPGSIIANLTVTAAPINESMADYNVTLKDIVHAFDARRASGGKENLPYTPDSITGASAMYPYLCMKDYNECADQEDLAMRCDEAARCINTIGSFECVCPVGTIDVSPDPTFTGRKCSYSETDSGVYIILAVVSLAAVTVVCIIVCSSLIYLKRKRSRLERKFIKYFNRDTTRRMPMSRLPMAYNDIQGLGDHGSQSRRQEGVYGNRE
ncbi:unnamed protein product [Owenia fusiformis]|uniref:Uncharacterized protein n=1 Tax=Owenia fusiformis TaxID=6347 RepID=A0A8J1UPW0_OWEFU|nr:unnamed protein product [Owenia fusiformis]